MVDGNGEWYGKRAGVKASLKECESEMPGEPEYPSLACIGSVHTQRFRELCISNILISNGGGQSLAGFHNGDSFARASKK